MDRIDKIEEFINHLGKTGQTVLEESGTNDDLDRIIRKLNAFKVKCNGCMSSRAADQDELAKNLADAQSLARLGNWTLDLVANKLTWSDEIYRIFGLEPQEFEANYEAFLATIHPDDLDYVNVAYTASVESDVPYDIIHRIIRKDGEVRYVHERARHDKDRNGKVLRSLGTVQDVTRRVMDEQEIKKSLHEKEILLKEIHHRVKNNLQVIMSLLYLQSQNTEDRKVAELFLESRDRVQSMALVHEQMYQSRDLSNIAVEDYIQTLLQNLFQSYNASDINLEFEIGNIMLSIEQAVPCGLVVNELVTNSLKHAFQNYSGPDKKTIYVKFGNSNGKSLLEVSDNGSGLSADYDLEGAESLGLMLVNTLVDQLDGKIDIDTSSGTRFLITF